MKFSSRHQPDTPSSETPQKSAPPNESGPQVELTQISSTLPQACQTFSKTAILQILMAPDHIFTSDSKELERSLQATNIYGLHYLFSLLQNDEVDESDRPRPDHSQLSQLQSFYEKGLDLKRTLSPEDRRSVIRDLPVVCRAILGDEKAKSAVIADGPLS